MIRSATLRCRWMDYWRFWESPWFSLEVSLPFFRQKNSSLTLAESNPILTPSQQLTILSAVEDLESVTSRVYAQCEECFRSTLIAYNHSSTTTGSGSRTTSDPYVLPPSPRALLKKSVSATTASSNFSLIGNDMLESARTRSQSGSGSGLASAGSSGVLVPRPGDKDGAYERGWDWRKELGEETRGEDILRMLRLGLARGLSLGVLG